MKILFAVSNENVSDAIVKSYQKNYNEAVTYKNVFYFNAIIKEIQRDRTYDIIIISEDLEPFANKNYDSIDKFIFERLSSISSEINDFSDKRIPIILICTDRRTKSSSMINKLFNAGIYDALIGSDRKIDNVCKLISSPRSKDEAEEYYKLANDSGGTSSIEDVSEEEVKNIVNYYKKLGKNEDRYVDSFNNIASQYTDAQLKIIVRYLPINVKAVLEAECPKYQELVTYANDQDALREKREKEKLKQEKLREQEEYEERVQEQFAKKRKEQKAAKPNQNQNNNAFSIDMLNKTRPNIQGNVVIPGAIDTRVVRSALSADEMNMESSRTIRPEQIPVSQYQENQVQPQPNHNQYVKQASTMQTEPIDNNMNNTGNSIQQSVNNAGNQYENNNNINNGNVNNNGFSNYNNTNMSNMDVANNSENITVNENSVNGLDSNLNDMNALNSQNQAFNNSNNGIQPQRAEITNNNNIAGLDAEPVEEATLPGFEDLVSEEEQHTPEAIKQEDLQINPQPISQMGEQINQLNNQNSQQMQPQSTNNQNVPNVQIPNPMARVNPIQQVPNNVQNINGFGTEVAKEIESQQVNNISNQATIQSQQAQVAQNDSLSGTEKINEVGEESNIGTAVQESTTSEIVEPVKRGRGRPRKTPVDAVPKPKGKRGRPRKNPLPEENENVIEESAVSNATATSQMSNDSTTEESAVLPGFEDFEFVDLNATNQTQANESSVNEQQLGNLNNNNNSNNGIDEFATLPGLNEIEEPTTSSFSSFDTFERPEGKTPERTKSLYTPENEMVKEDDQQENVNTFSGLPGFEEEEQELVQEPTQTNNMQNNMQQPANQATNNEDSSFSGLPGFEEEEQELVQEPLQANNMQNNMQQPFNQVTNSNDSSFSGLPGFEEEFESSANTNNENMNLNGSNMNNYNNFNNNSQNLNNFSNQESTLPGLNDFDDDEENEEGADPILRSPQNFEEIDNSFNSNIPNSNMAGTMAELPGFEEEMEEEENVDSSNVLSATSYRNDREDRKAGMQKLEEKRVFSTGSLDSVLTPDKKIVAFVGTSKNGTSFIVNNLASLFSSIAVKTAILDMTKNRNSYYIYTNNDENLRRRAQDCIDKLEDGVAEGINADRNLNVYTAIPNDEKDFSNAEAILTTLIKNESLVLIDCDFDTPLGYFANAQEIYLVQSMDILTIQPLTAFLRELKTNGILDQEKLRVVVNKELKVRGLTSKTIIGGMSFYNDPGMSYMTELFNKDKIKACTIPFEDSTYSKYLETLVNCNVSISGYSKSFMNSLKILGNMIYPLSSKQTYIKSGPDYTRSNFSDEMNNTLDQMRKKY